jgi:Putative Actinobacterial Holin-X, holin superfamily III
MLHPLFSTIIHKPGLVIDHLAAYGALVRLEASNAGSELITRVVAWLLALFAGIIFLGFAGIAIMLGFVNNNFSWALVIVPGVPLIIAISAFIMAKKPLRSEHFPELKAQIKSDAQALQAVI